MNWKIAQNKISRMKTKIRKHRKVLERQKGYSENMLHTIIGVSEGK